MSKLLALSCLFLCLSIQPAPAVDALPFQLVYRQENVAVDRFNTRSDLMITVLNLGGAEARDVIVAIHGPNPYLFIDSPVVVGTIPDGRQLEILHNSCLPNDVVALAEPADQLTWRIEYTDASGVRTANDVQGVRGQ